MDTDILHLLAQARKDLGAPVNVPTPRPTPATSAFWSPFFQEVTRWYQRRRYKLGKSLITHEYRVGTLERSLVAGDFSLALKSEAAKAFPSIQKADYFSDQFYESFLSDLDKQRTQYCIAKLNYLIHSAKVLSKEIQLAISRLVPELKVKLFEKVSQAPESKDNTSYIPKLLADWEAFITLDPTNPEQSDAISLFTFSLNVAPIQMVDDEIRMSLNKVRESPAKKLAERLKSREKEVEDAKKREEFIAALPTEVERLQARLDDLKKVQKKKKEKEAYLKPPQQSKSQKKQRKKKKKQKQIPQQKQKQKPNHSVGTPSNSNPPKSKPKKKQAQKNRSGNGQSQSVRSGKANSRK